MSPLLKTVFAFQKIAFRHTRRFAVVMSFEDVGLPAFRAADSIYLITRPVFRKRCLQFCSEFHNRIDRSSIFVTTVSSKRTKTDEYKRHHEHRRQHIINQEIH